MFCLFILNILTQIILSRSNSIITYYCQIKLVSLSSSSYNKNYKIITIQKLINSLLPSDKDNY